MRGRTRSISRPLSPRWWWLSSCSRFPGSERNTWIRRSCGPPIRWWWAVFSSFSPASSSAAPDADRSCARTLCRVRRLSKMIRLAHLTDPHVGPLPRPKLRELLNKRITGWVNWHRGRNSTHDMDVLEALVADIREQAPDHILCTGDVCNIGLPEEWKTSRVFMETLGDPRDVSFVPGNHDAYVPGSLEGLLAEIAPYTRGDDGVERSFPYLRRRGVVAIIGLSSAIPTLPFVATGRLGRRQVKDVEEMLGDLGRDCDCFRIVLIHHPPHRTGADSGRELTDAHRFEAMLKRVGAELVLH